MTKYNRLNAIQISKESLGYFKDVLTQEQAGKVLFAIYDYVYEGIEPKFDNEVSRKMYERALSFTIEKADMFMNQHRNFFDPAENPAKSKNKEQGVEMSMSPNSNPQKKQIANTQSNQDDDFFAAVSLPDDEDSDPNREPEAWEEEYRRIMEREKNEYNQF